jgi:hypothetical protein
MLRQIIAERMGAGAGDPGPQLLAGTAVTIMDVVYRQWIATDAEADIASLIDNAFHCFSDLMSPP